MKIASSYSENKTIKAFGSNQTVAPETPRGYLVHENFAQGVKSTVGGYVKNAKYAVDAVNGKGNDYSVGKINDLTLRVGGVGIAAILSASAKTPIAKFMEFAGFASFFGAMSLWPKCFIAAPLKAKTGFDVNQEYVDSYGRRKRFFEDSQYLPWDLWDKKEISKIGDKLGIPKNIENRDDHTKAKMKQIATQSTTLWMMTAGFATPLMASLMGNYISKYSEEVLKDARVKINLKKAGLEDFTKASDSVMKKIFINPISSIVSLMTKKVDAKNPAEELKALDKAYDAVFGKACDPVFEYNQGSLLYNMSDDMMKTQYDDVKGLIVEKDVNGNVVKKIKTKNIDGVSIIGNKWKEIPNKLADILGVTPKKYKQLMKNSLTVKNGTNPDEAELLADMLIKEFGGSENNDKVQKALQKMEKVLMPSVVELENAQKVFEKKINEVKGKIDANSDLSKYVVNRHSERLADKGINTKSSWYAPVRILDIIVKHSADDMNDVEKAKSFKAELRQFIYGVTPHQIHNNFDDVIKGNYSDDYRYTLGIDKSFAPLCEKTKEMLGKDSKLAKNVDGNTNFLWNKFYEIAGEKGKHFESICDWLGKTPQAFLSDATKQTGIYHGWLKVAGVSFAALTGITLVAISKFGKSNKYNQEVYKYTNESTRS